MYYGCVYCKVKLINNNNNNIGMICANKKWIKCLDVFLILVTYTRDLKNDNLVEINIDVADKSW